ncbi:MAG: hypothetical protein IPN34_13585 [Planctomycetes bacterium]|nr:hypothetical protein [Planctomycetota bacterium]
MFEGLFGGGRNEAARLERMERKLDLILRHLGLATDGKVELSEEVRALAEANHMIAAIKALRAETGLGLAEAKAAIDAHRAARGL